MISPRASIIAHNLSDLLGNRWLARHRFASALAAILFAALAAEFWSLGALGFSGLLVLLFLLAIAPGIVLATRIYGHEGGRATAWLVGPVWGFALTSIVLLGLWVAGLHHALVLVLAPALALAAVAVFGPRSPLLTPIRPMKGELAAALLVLLMVPAVVGRPFSQVGVDVGDGRAYRAYFTADFVWKMAVVAEVAKGEVPPANPFMAGDRLHYYWLPHLFSAAEHRALSPYLRLEPQLLINATLFGLLFVLFLYALARQCGVSPPAAVAGVAIAIAGGSFEGAERLQFVWSHDVPLAFLKTLNIDAASRWFYGALPTDGLHRLLLYQPQHHAMAYATGLSAILAIWQARDLRRAGVWLFAGSCLAACLLLSAFSALLLTCMTIPVAAISLLRHRQLRLVATASFVAAIPGVIAAWWALALGYVQRGESLITIGRNPMAFARPWPALPMNFGIAMPITIAAIAAMALRRRVEAWLLGIPIAIAAGFYFFVDVVDMQGVYVGWRVAHLVFMLTAPLAAWCVQALWNSSRVVRVAGFTSLAAGMLLAIPTLVIDLYNTQDVTNRAAGPGFKWTLVLSPDEQAAFEWIRAETPPWAIVQVEPFCRGAATWSYIPSFAERRMAAGLPISMIPFEPYRQASERIQKIFTATTAEAAFIAAARGHVDYLEIGLPEEERYPQLVNMLDSAPALFPLRFRAGEVRIYQVGSVLRHEPPTHTGLLLRTSHGT